MKHNMRLFYGHYTLYCVRQHPNSPSEEVEDSVRAKFYCWHAHTGNDYMNKSNVF